MSCTSTWSVGEKKEKKKEKDDELLLRHPHGARRRPFRRLITEVETRMLYLLGPM